MRVWIDQDLCTGDGLCTDHCPEVFMLLEDGMSYVREAGTATARLVHCGVGHLVYHANHLGRIDGIDQLVRSVRSW